MSIVRKDKQVVWLLLSRTKYFKRIPYGPEQDLRVSEMLDREVSWRETGTEVREEHPTILYEITTKQGRQVEIYFQWIATEIHFPMKLARKDWSLIVECQHVKLRSVSDYFFNLPVNFLALEDFKKQEAPEPVEPGM